MFELFILLCVMGIACLFFGLIVPAVWITYLKVFKRDKRSIWTIYNEI